MGSQSILPGGLIATAAHAVAARARGALGVTKRRKRRKKKGRTKSVAGRKVTVSAAKRKPKPGTKAWMAYIRSKRKK